MAKMIHPVKSFNCIAFLKMVRFPDMIDALVPVALGVPLQTS